MRNERSMTSISRPPQLPGPRRELAAALRTTPCPLVGSCTTDDRQIALLAPGVARLRCLAPSLHPRARSDDAPKSARLRAAAARYDRQLELQRARRPRRAPRPAAA
jgi:hypothetical protein